MTKVELNGDDPVIRRRAQEIQMADHTLSWGVCLDLSIQEYRKKLNR